MKRIEIIALATLLALVLAPVAWAENDVPVTEGSVEVGGWDADTNDSPDLVTEYETTEGGFDLRLDVGSYQEWGTFLLDGAYRDSDEYDLGLVWEVGRWLRTDTRYTGLLHRLGRDPLTDLVAATNHGRSVFHTDLVPADEDFELSYSVLEHRTEIQPMRASAVTFAVNYRRQEREGQRQALTVSHCSACHVVSQRRPVDETTEDIGADVLFAWGSGQLRASYNHRELTEANRNLFLLFDDALQPELLVPVFDNRLQWDSAEGPQPVHQQPDITKDTVKLDLALPEVGGFALNAEGVWSTTENDVTGLQSDYGGYLFAASRAFKESWRLRWRARAYSIDNDDVFVDIAERVGIAGAQAGRTFREIYGFDPDYLRQSALSRDVVESRFDLSHRFGKKAGTVRLLWDYESVDRESFEVAPGDTETTENVLGLTWNARPKKGVRLNAAYRHGEVDNPFVTLDGQFSTLVSDKVSSPFAPNSAQYYQFHDARIADGTARPESWDELKVGFGYTAGESSFSASYRYWDGDNTGGDLTDWSRTSQSATLSYWAAPTPSFEWNIAYAWNDSELDLPASIPIFDG